MGRLIIIFVFFFITINRCFATDVLLTADNGLSNTLFNGLLQTSYGDIFIATENGLNCYDGATVKKYFYNQNNPYSLADNYINSVVETRDGKIWVSTHSGVQIFDNDLNCFYNVDLHLSDNKGIVKTSVKNVLQLEDDRILISTISHGIFEYNPDSAAAYQLNCSQLGYVIINIAEDSQHNLWVASGDYGLTKRSPKGDIKKYTFEGKINGQTSISAIACCSDGNVYVASFVLGLFMYDKQNDDFVKISEGDFIYGIYPLSNGMVYVGTEGNGLKIINPNSHTINKCNLSYGNLDFSNGKIHGVICDNKDNLWVAIYQKGVLKQTVAKYPFNYYGCRSWAENIIGNNCISSVYKSKDGFLYVGTDSDGLYVVDTKINSSKHYVSDGENSFPSVIMSMVEDKNGEIWIGSFNDGLCCFNPKTGKYDYVYSNKPLQHKIFNVYDLCVDKDGNIWAVTMGSGFFRINPNTLEVLQIPPAPIDMNKSLSSNVLNEGCINCVYYIPDGFLFLGTFNGLACYDIKNESFTTFFNGKNHILDGTIIYSVYYDGINIWVGTGTGLIKATSDGRYKTYTVADGLAGDMICGILPDDDNNLWISTNNGLSKFEIYDDNFYNFFVDDGLQGNEFCKNSAFNASDGTLIFGGMYGVTLFNPEKIHISPDILTVSLSEILINGKGVDVSTEINGIKVLSNKFMLSDTFTIAQKDLPVTVVFSVGNNQSINNITFSYSIENDKETKLPCGNNRIQFDGFDYGEHHIKVKASANNNVSDVKSYVFVVPTPFYMGSTAKKIYFGIFLIGLFCALAYLYKYFQKKKMPKPLLYGSDQFGNAWLQLLENIAVQYSSSDENYKRKFTSYIYDFINLNRKKITLNTKSVDIIEFTKKLGDNFAEKNKDKNINYVFHSDFADLTAEIDEERIANIVNILLNNSLKFSQNDFKIHLSIDFNPDNINTFYITVADDGIGVPEFIDVNNMFDALFSLQPNSGKDFSTCLNLYVVNGILKLHGGELIIKRGNPSGTIASCLLKK